MYSLNAFTTSAMPLNCESGRNLPKRGTLGGDNFPMSNLGRGCVKGNPLLPFLFKLRFSSVLRDGIGVFKPALAVSSNRGGYWRTITLDCKSFGFESSPPKWSKDLSENQKQRVVQYYCGIVCLLCKVFRYIPAEINLQSQDSGPHRQFTRRALRSTLQNDLR